MKTTKTLLTIALVALTTTLFGRIGEPEEDCNCCPSELFADQEMSTEEWMTEPFASSFEVDIRLESWMAKPFDSDFETVVALEEWMSLPFESSFEPELAVESWMKTPFDTTEEIKLEWWMATAWL